MIEYEPVRAISRSIQPLTFAAPAASRPHWNSGNSMMLGLRVKAIGPAKQSAISTTPASRAAAPSARSRRALPPFSAIAHLRRSTEKQQGAGRPAGEA